MGHLKQAQQRQLQQLLGGIDDWMGRVVSGTSSRMRDSNIDFDITMAD